MVNNQIDNQVVDQKHKNKKLKVLKILCSVIVQ